MVMVYDLAEKSRVSLRFNRENLTRKLLSLRFNLTEIDSRLSPDQKWSVPWSVPLYSACRLNDQTLRALAEAPAQHPADDPYAARSLSLSRQDRCLGKKGGRR
jgi:hypothetical protein